MAGQARHGTHARYAGAGCRCETCRHGEKLYRRRQRARQRGIGLVGDPPSTPARVDGPDGPVTAAVKAEVDMIPGAESRPALVQTALVLAADLDTRGCVTSHPSLSKQLRETMTELYRSRQVGRSRLRAITELSRARPSTPAPA